MSKAVIWRIGEILARIVLAAALLQFAIGQVVPKPGPISPVRQITIVTEPNTAVWLNGVLYGKTAENGRITIRSAPASAVSLRLRANGFKEVSRPVTAAQNGEISVPLAKTNDEAELALQQAEALASIDRANAVATYKKAIAARPSYLDAYIGLARLYSEAGDFDNALKAVREARKLKPGVAELSVIEGRTYKDSGDEAKAIVAFKRAITEGKGFQPEAYTGLGLLYKDRAEAAGSANDLQAEAANYREAAKYFSTASKQLSGAPDGIVVYQLLGLIYEKQKRFKEAIALYEDFLRVFPDSPESTAVQSFITQIKKQMADQP